MIINEQNRYFAILFFAFSAIVEHVIAVVHPTN